MSGGAEGGKLGNVLVGIARLARFRVDGFAAFQASPQAVLNSLAPLVAFPLVGGLIELGQGRWQSALVDVLTTVVALLTPLVVSEFLARRWGRETRWLRFAVASNWAQWALPMVLMAMVVGLWLLSNLGIPMSRSVIGACMLGIFVYGLALHWFLARAGLDLSRGRAALLVGAADVLTGLLVIGPRLMAGPP